MVADNISGKGIDKATLSVNEKIYFSTNANGAVNIDKSTLKARDSIIISCVGYKSKTIKSVIGNSYPDTIKLSASVTILNEVTVKTTSKEIILGDVKKRYNARRALQPEDQLLQFIPNDKNIKGTITAVEYVLNDMLHGIETPFKVRLYLKRKGSVFPGEELTKDSIIVYNPEKKRRVTVDISKYNIPFPEDGVMVVFETLSPRYYKKDLAWKYDRQELKMPGIEMDFKNKDEYTIDYEEQDRKGPYVMVISLSSKRDFTEAKHYSYVYTEGISAAITIIVSP